MASAQPFDQFDHLLPGIWASKFHTRTCSANSESGPNHVQYTIHLIFLGVLFLVTCFFFRFLYDVTFEADWFPPWPVKPRSVLNLNPTRPTKTSWSFWTLVFPGVLHFNGYLGYVSPNVSICNYTLYTYLYYTYFASYLQDLGTRHFDIFFLVVLSSTPLTDLRHWQVTPHCAVQDVPGMRSKLLAAGSRPEV